MKVQGSACYQRGRRSVQLGHWNMYTYTPNSITVSYRCRGLPWPYGLIWTWWDQMQASLVSRPSVQYWESHWGSGGLWTLSDSERTVKCMLTWNSKTMSGGVYKTSHTNWCPIVGAMLNQTAKCNFPQTLLVTVCSNVNLSEHDTHTQKEMHPFTSDSRTFSPFSFRTTILPDWMNKHSIERSTRY